MPRFTSARLACRTPHQITKMQKPVEPAESIKHMVVPKGLKVELFAAEPLIYRPICMNWDEKGRLWIAETVDYPNELKPKGDGRDVETLAAFLKAVRTIAPDAAGPPVIIYETGRIVTSDLNSSSRPR